MNFEKENYRRICVDIEKAMTDGSTVLELLKDGGGASFSNEAIT